LALEIGPKEEKAWSFDGCCFSFKVVSTRNITWFPPPIDNNKRWRSISTTL
jgi:hypothetical protein